MRATGSVRTCRGDPGSRDVPGWPARGHLRAVLAVRAGPPVAGIEQALLAVGNTLGPDLGYVETLSAAALLDREGHPTRSRALVADVRSRMTPLQRRRMDQYVASNRVPLPH